MSIFESSKVLSPYPLARRWLKGVGHCAVLLFGAFWLVATGSNDPVAYNCFTGITNPTTLAVPVGSAVVASDGGTVASCQGLDGLQPSASITLSLSQGSRPDGRICYGYKTTAVEGLTDITFDQGPSISVQSSYPKALTIATGAFSSSQNAGCNGTWTFVLEPQQPLSDEGPIVSPLDASASNPWLVVRTMDLAQAQSCGSGFATASGELRCSDTFTVDSISQVAAP